MREGGEPADVLAGDLIDAAAEPAGQSEAVPVPIPSPMAPPADAAPSISPPSISPPATAEPAAADLPSETPEDISPPETVPPDAQPGRVTRDRAATDTHDDADLFLVPGSVTSTADDFFGGLHRRVGPRD